MYKKVMRLNSHLIIFIFIKVILIIHLQLIIMPWEIMNYSLALANKSWESL